MLELVDYNYYRNNYEGNSIPSDSFKKLAIDASSRINRYTSHRINKDILNEDIKNTACMIAELLYSQSELKRKQDDDKSSKASETVGPHSVTYVNKSNLQAQRILSSEELDKECYKICYTNLVHTGLMYRGVTRCSHIQ